MDDAIITSHIALLPFQSYDKIGKIAKKKKKKQKKLGSTYTWCYQCSLDQKVGEKGNFKPNYTCCNSTSKLNQGTLLEYKSINHCEMEDEKFLPKQPYSEWDYCL